MNTFLNSKLKSISFLLGLFLVVSAAIIVSGRNLVSADEIDEVQQQIDEQNSKLEQIKQDIENSKNQISELSSDRSVLYQELSQIQSELDNLNSRLEENKTTIDNLGVQLNETSDLINKRVEQRNIRFRSMYYDLKIPIIDKLLGSESLNVLSKYLKYKEMGIREDRANIVALSDQLGQLEANLEEGKLLQEELVAVNESLAAKSAQINSQIAGVNYEIAREQQRQSAMGDEISYIEGAIADLSAYQQELIRQKLLATQFNTSVGSVEQGIQYLDSPGFSDGFAFFTYGYPHRVGMNQYGAYGRAIAGQSAEQILSSYYSNISIDKNYSVPETIPVVGYGNVNLQDYLKGLGEMPSCWNLEALKAQVVAARTYALNYIYYSWNGSEFVEKSPTSICTTQSCQVYLGGWKGGECADNWYRAVDETDGWVITYAGKPITAWYASTAGGYTRSAQNVWGGYRPWALGISDYDDSGNAYDGPQWGDSPWYHKAWGETSNGNPWMTNEEAQDIFNAYLLSEHSSSYNQNLSPVDKGGWSMESVRNELISLGISPVGKINGITTVDDGTGYINSVIIDSEGYGVKEFDGYLFRSMFNLRSPGTLVIWTSRFDVQKS